MGEWTLGFSYADYIVWHNRLGKNSWQLCCFDEANGQFIHTTLNVPAVMEDWYIDKIQMATTSLAIYLLCDFPYHILAVDISNPEASINLLGPMNSGSSK